jgi:MoxR-like ATPase
LSDAVTDLGLGSIDDIREALSKVDYLADDRVAGTVFLGERLGKPVLVEGPAGTGKTQLAKSFAAMTGRRLIRLQCYEGLDESRALYEWNYRKQLLQVQRQAVSADAATGAAPADEASENLFSEDFLLERPLLAAIRAQDPVVLLIDEVDRLDIETEALLLEILSEFQVSIPELGTMRARQIPSVFLTSNNSRDLSEALKRRCLFLHLDYPSVKREYEIIARRVPELGEHMAEQVAGVVHSLRMMDLRKPPSVAESLDWARTLVLLGAREVDVALVTGTLHVLLKYQGDIELAERELRRAN